MKIACPICNEKTILVEHHIKGREIHNSEHPSNKVNICSNCHRLIHEGIIIIEGWFSTSNGIKLFWHKKGEKSFTGQAANPPIYGKWGSESKN